MKSFLFLANDPGGMDAVFPVYDELSKRDDITVKLMLAGRTAELKSQYRFSEKQIIEYIDECISEGREFILVTGTSWNSVVEAEAIERCRASGIKTVSILDYWSNYRRRFSYKDGFIYPDQLFVMDEMAFNEAVKDGVPSEIMKITGNPGLDYYAKIRSNSKKVLFMSQPLSVINKEYEGYDEFVVMEDLLKACRELGIKAHVKCHPKDTEKFRETYSSISVEGELEKLVQDYDAVVGMTTMGLLQCSLMGVPVISYEPDLNTEDKSIVNKLGITKGAYSYEELVHQLRMITGSYDEKKLPGWFDGESTERCLTELLNL